MTPIDPYDPSIPIEKSLGQEEKWTDDVNLVSVNVSGFFYHWSMGPVIQTKLIGTDLSSKVQLRFESLIKGT